MALSEVTVLPLIVFHPSVFENFDARDPKLFSLVRACDRFFRNESLEEIIFYSVLFVLCAGKYKLIQAFICISELMFGLKSQLTC